MSRMSGHFRTTANADLLHALGAYVFLNPLPITVVSVVNSDGYVIRRHTYSLIASRKRWCSCAVQLSRTFVIVYRFLGLRHER